MSSTEESIENGEQKSTSKLVIEAHALKRLLPDEKNTPERRMHKMTVTFAPESCQPTY